MYFRFDLIDNVAAITIADDAVDDDTSNATSMCNCVVAIVTVVSMHFRTQYTLTHIHYTYR